MKKSFKIIGSLIVIAGVIGGGVWYWQKNKSVDNQPTIVNQPVATTTAEVNQNSTSTSTQQITDETANWTVYRNQTYGYSIKYPNNWYVYNPNAEKPFTFKNGLYIDRFDIGGYSGGDVSWSNYEGAFPPGEEPADWYIIDSIVFKIDPAMSIDNFVAAHNFGLINKDKSQVVSSDFHNAYGISGKQFYFKNDNAPSNQPGDAVFIKNGGNLYLFIISISGLPDSMPPAEKKVYEEMLSTFQFLK